MKRINAHYRWLKNPPQAEPRRGELGLPERTVIPADHLAAAQAAIQKQVDLWSWRELEGLDPATRWAVQDEFTRRLLEIRNGAWSYDQLVEYTMRQDAELEALAATSPLPKLPDRARLDRVCMAVIHAGRKR